MSAGDKKAYQRVDKFKEDEGMFEETQQDDNSKSSTFIKEIDS
jgi:hypothetical protein